MLGTVHYELYSESMTFLESACPLRCCHTDIKYVSVMAAKVLKVEVESMSLFLWIPCSLLLGNGFYTHPQMNVITITCSLSI